MPVVDRDLANRPTRCPRGHPLGPGQFTYSWEQCGQPCGRPGNGHHWLICRVCDARIWLGHTDATWVGRKGEPL